MTIAWLSSLIPSLPCFFIFDVLVKVTEDGATREECVSDFKVWSDTTKKSYFSGIFMMIFVIPLCTMLFLYTHMLIKLRESTKANKMIKQMELKDMNWKVG